MLVYLLRRYLTSSITRVMSATVTRQKVLDAIEASELSA